MPKKLPSIRIFLSHRYKSPETNLYFFKIFSERAEFQFEVDEGSRPTCVTRLERMIRNAHAFVGIYPYPEPDQQAPGIEAMKEATRYFRLELDLAVRSRKPALVFYDRRYGPLLECPSSFHTHPFDMREILGGGGGSTRQRHQREFEDFLREIVAFCGFANARRGEPPYENQTAIIVPPGGDRYTQAERDGLLSTIACQGCHLVDLPWPPRLTLDFLSKLDRADWVVSDIGETTSETGMPSYLHGQFYPTVRLLGARERAVSPLETTLFGGTEVGYVKDIVRWQDEASLRGEVEKRLALIKAPSTWIANLNQALEYFGKTALRKEQVFLSYAGADREVGAKISVELKKHFHKVFDYRDGVSIATGRPWMDEVFESLAASAVGVPLFSANYFATENCLHEARQMVSRVDLKKMTILPVKIDEAELTLPDWAQSFQYARYIEYKNDPIPLVRWLLQCYDRCKK